MKVRKKSLNFVLSVFYEPWSLQTLCGGTATLGAVGSNTSCGTSVPLNLTADSSVGD